VLLLVPVPPTLEPAPCVVEPVPVLVGPLPAEFERFLDAQSDVLRFEAARVFAFERTARHDLLSPASRDELAAGAAIPRHRYLDAQAVIARCRTLFASAIAPYDLLLSASAAGEAPADLSNTGEAMFNRWCSGLRVPCLNLPGFTAYIKNPRQMPPYTAKVLSDAQAADLWAFIKAMPESPAADKIPLLSRIINEQGRSQVGRGWGDAKNPQCGGFTIAELQSLRFDVMDFSEFYASIVPVMPNVTGIQGNNTTRVPACYYGQGKC